VQLREDTAIHTAYEDHQALDPAMPERNLMRAVLKTAMDDIRKSGELYRDARAFMLSSDESYLFSFMSICRHLNLCHLTILRVCGIEQPRRRDQRKMAA
jgi:hypothetical protein